MKFYQDVCHQECHCDRKSLRIVSVIREYQSGRLQILESQGLAKRLATRHVVVADFSDEVITEIYELLSDVEIKLLKGMLQSGICLWDKAVSDNSEQPNCVYEPSTINEKLSAELQFHETIISNSHNEYFTHILENGLWCYIRFAVEETAAALQAGQFLTC